MNRYTSAAESWQMLSGILQAAQMIPKKQRAADGSLPLTVIGGFLGAGKTTLLSHLLTQPHGRRIAVLVNDFGRINIDAALVRSRTEDMISLTNGCACCTVAGDLTRTLIQLAQRPEPPDAIVLEASGLADPRGIAQVALANPALRLDGLLALVDAETLSGHAADPTCQATFMAQIAAADLIVLNKLDLVDAPQRAAIRAWLDANVPGKPVIEAVHAKLPAEVVLGIHSTQDLWDAGATSPDHARGFRSWSAGTTALLDADRIRAMLNELPDDVLRAKGILQVSTDPGRRTVFQRVGRRSGFVTEDWCGEAPNSRLVVIGREGSLEPDALSRRFEQCRS